MTFNKIEDVIKDIQNGKMVIVVDDESRENEGDFIMAAEKVTPEDVNFMAKYGRGLICVPLTKERVEQLELPQMVENNTETMKTAFTISIDHKNTTTGISAYERALTIRALADQKATAQDFNKPGHIFPLRAQDGGVLKRAGHTEAAIDLCRLAGLYSAGVICEIMNDDGTMARVPELEVIAEKFSLKMVTVADLISYRMRNEKLVKRVAETELPTKHGVFRAIAYQSLVDSGEHVALVKGDVAGKPNVLVRVHSGCVWIFTL
jgi:3,4-dihydroxy 2-butanone 4-phosphate synthase/GTP cyclohydrolase II